MSVQSVGIVTDCVCDLPKSYINEHNIGIVYFLIETDSGVFTDTDEITAENILSYIEAGGKKSISSPPPVEVYENVFRDNLKKYSEVVFASISSGTSASYQRASDAAAKMGDDGKHIHVFDSKHLSTGLGHIVIKAAEMAESGCSAKEILSELEDLRDRVSTTFLAVNADYLYRNGRISDSVRKLCDMFDIHPVLMMKDGKIALKSIMLGNYEKASLRYVRKELKFAKNISKKRIFITHAGCSSKKIEKIKEEINKKCCAESLIVTKASATVSSNCGPETFGVLFVNERKPQK